MLLKHWIIARKQDGHVLGPLDQDRQRSWTKHMPTASIKQACIYFMLSGCKPLDLWGGRVQRLCWGSSSQTGFLYTSWLGILGMVCPSKKVASNTTRRGNTYSIHHARPSGVPLPLGIACQCNFLQVWSGSLNSKTVSVFCFYPRQETSIKASGGQLYNSCARQTYGYHIAQHDRWQVNDTNETSRVHWHVQCYCCFADAALHQDFLHIMHYQDMWEISHFMDA